MEQFHDYRMVDGRSVLEQAHEIQTPAKELKIFGCVLPDKFVAGCIIAKLPQAWINFATFLKHKRQEFGIAELFGSLMLKRRREQRTFVARKLVRGVLPMWCTKSSQIPQEEIPARTQTKVHHSF